MTGGAMPPIRPDLQGAGVTTGGQNAGGRRALAGQHLEASLATTHQVYADRRQGLIVKQQVPSVRVTRETASHRHESLLKASGLAVVDYLGWLCWDSPDDHARVVQPVAFDAKSFSDRGASSYQHDPQARHQLQFLLDAGERGAWAFLLLMDDVRGVGWILHRRDDLRALFAGGRVGVCVRSASNPSGFYGHQLPHFTANLRATTVDQAPGFDWLPAARAVFGG